MPRSISLRLHQNDQSYEKSRLGVGQNTMESDELEKELREAAQMHPSAFQLYTHPRFGMSLPLVRWSALEPPSSSPDVDGKTSFLVLESTEMHLLTRCFPCVRFFPSQSSQKVSSHRLARRTSTSMGTCKSHREFKT